MRSLSIHFAVIGVLGCAAEPVAREAPPTLDVLVTPGDTRSARALAGAPLAALVLRGGDEEQRLERQGLAAERAQQPLPPIPRDHPRLPFLQEGSVSVGTSSNGWLVRGAELPLEGPHHRIMTVQSARGTRYGAEELVKALQDAAAAVARQYPGSVLQVGNIARQGGGDIPWSVSHNSGRDADVGFFVLDRHGKPVALDDLVKLNDRGGAMLGSEPVRFDAGRTWAFAKALLKDRHIRLQYVFLSKPLKELVLAHGRKRHEDAKLLALADEILRQPVGAARHDDHLHVRIVCPKADVAEGCVDTLKLPEGYVPPTAGRTTNIGKARGLLRSAAADERRSAVLLLRLLGARETAPAVEALVTDAVPVVRTEALRTLMAFDAKSSVGAIARQLRLEDDETAAVAAVRALVALDSGPTAVAALIATLERAVDRVRREALRALGRLTNHVLVPYEEATALPGDTYAVWTAWLAAQGKAPRDRWLIDGFRRAGFDVQRLDRRAADELCRAIRAPEPVGTNAVRQLMTITRNNARKALDWPLEDRFAYWKQWLKRHGYAKRCGDS